jgi:hypothetical protein
MIISVRHQNAEHHAAPELVDVFFWELESHRPLQFSLIAE